MTRTYVTILLSRESKQRNEKNKQFTFVSCCHILCDLKEGTATCKSCVTLLS